MPPKLSHDIKQEAVILAAKGLKPDEITVNLNISVSTVRRVDTRVRKHGDVEGGKLGRGGHEILFEEDHPLDCSPAGAAPFLRPRYCRPALGIQNPLPANGIFLAGRVPELHPVARVRGEVLLDESADFLAEGAFFLGEAKIHWMCPPTGG